jgi:hypothetical protein
MPARRSVEGVPDTHTPSDWRQLEFPPPNGGRLETPNGGCLATSGKRWVSGNHFFCGRSMNEKNYQGENTRRGEEKMTASELEPASNDDMGHRIGVEDRLPSVIKMFGYGSLSSLTSVPAGNTISNT